MVVIEMVVNFFVGYFREYYPMILMLSAAHFGGPYLVDFIMPKIDARLKARQQKQTDAP